MVKLKRLFFFLSTLLFSITLWGEENLLINGEVNELVSFALLEISKPESERNTKVAIEAFEAAAIKGSATAMHSLGLIYAEGVGVKKDREKAFSFYSESAKSLFPPSQNDLANLYMDGYPDSARTFYNYRKAAKLYENAANSGYKYAQFNLGNAYRTGKGKAKDLIKAHSWFEKAAQQGVSEAMYFLGVSYESGAAGVKDEPTAFYWFCRAAKEDIQITLLLESRYSGSESCNEAIASNNGSADSSFIAQRLNKLQKDSEKKGLERRRKALASGEPTNVQERGESQLQSSFSPLFKFLGEVAVSVVTVAITAAIVYKISEELDLDTQSSYKPIQNDRRTGPLKFNNRASGDYRSGAGQAITSGKCSCECVNGKVEALCSSSAYLPAICTGVCPVVPPSVRPPDIYTVPLPGTSICRDEQVYNYDKQEYQWQKICR
jgi:hypothetical protein